MEYQKIKKISRQIFKSAIGILFGYFGILALINPELEAAKWLSQDIVFLINILMPENIFMLILGTVQVVTAILLIANKFSKIVLPVAAILLLGIIINLGWNEIALRDFVILTGVAYLYFSDKSILNKE